jgi:hypothetical protein
VNASMNGDYEEALRRALHAAADSIEPSADGLERIRERLNRPMLSFEAASAWSAGTAAWLRRVMEPVVAAFWAVIDRFRPAPAKTGHARPRYNWIRPAAGMGIAVFVVAAGAFALKTLPQAISPSASNSVHSAAGGNAPGTGGGGGGVNGGRSQDAAGAQPTEGGHRTAGVSPAATPCAPTPKAGKSSPATGSVSPSPSTSAPAGSTSPPVSGPPSSSPPVSVSPTTTPDPGAGGSGAPVSSPATTKATADSSAAACASKAPPKKAAPKTAPSVSSSPPASVPSSAPASSAPAKSGGTIGGTSGGTSTAPTTGAST